MGVEVLVQIDRLVQLLETPVFNFLRLHLLHPARYPALLWCTSRLAGKLSPTRPGNLDQEHFLM
jgi:hypothetical protein